MQGIHDMPYILEAFVNEKFVISQWSKLLKSVPLDINIFKVQIWISETAQ